MGARDQCPFALGVWHSLLLFCRKQTAMVVTPKKDVRNDAGERERRCTAASAGLDVDTCWRNKVWCFDNHWFVRFFNFVSIQLCQRQSVVMWTCVFREFLPAASIRWQHAVVYFDDSPGRQLSQMSPTISLWTVNLCVRQLLRQLATGVRHWTETNAPNEYPHVIAHQA